MKYFLLLLCFITSFACADVYMKQEANGHVVYSDIPTPGSTKVSVSSPETLSPEKTTTTTTTKETTTVKSDNDVTSETSTTESTNVSEAPNYTQFLIDSPVDQQTIQNQRAIPVVFVVKPELRKGDKIQVYLDDKPAGAPTSSLSVELGNVERGSHRIRGTLLDKDNNPVRQSQSITVFIHYAHVGNQQNKAGAGPTPP